MSRYDPAFSLSRRLPGLLVAGLVTAALLLAPALAEAGIVSVGQQTYRLNGGRSVTGMWEIAETLATTNDVAIVIMEPEASPSLVQELLRLLEHLKVATVLLKRADYQTLVKRGVLHPTPAS